MSENYTTASTECVSHRESGTVPSTHPSSAGGSHTPNANGAYTHTVQAMVIGQLLRYMWTTCLLPRPAEMKQIAFGPN